MVVFNYDNEKSDSKLFPKGFAAEYFNKTKKLPEQYKIVSVLNSLEKSLNERLTPIDKDNAFFHKHDKVELSELATQYKFKHNLQLRVFYNGTYTTKFIFFFNCSSCNCSSWKRLNSR